MNKLVKALKVVSKAIYEDADRVKDSLEYADKETLQQILKDFDLEGELEFRDPKDKLLAEIKQSIGFTPKRSKEFIRSNVIMGFRDLVFPLPGQYEFVFFIDERFLGRVTLDILQLEIQKVSSR